MQSTILSENYQRTLYLCSTSDEMSLGMMSSRDWNEELQSARELPQANVHEKIVRDRTIFSKARICEQVKSQC